MEKQAGFGIRFAADIVDALILTIPISTVFFLIEGDSPFTWMMGWTWPIIYTIYLTLVPLVWTGYIIGKRIFKIKVRRIDEEGLTLKTMVLREIVGKFLLSNVTFGISTLVSMFMIIFREDKRAIHDLIAGTYVSREQV
ncbi:RDD family protein [Cytobacillus firmus]|uniref:RDD family protein n=1 Tax=Cytobacillus firmus TaxID=1399 RepID=UPI0018CFA58B|nr:RDD family protein [Cytobacillus firmus]MBG9449155.1 RDD family protein [Cytobacillus firmus]MBY6053152.1 RDD family protein [Cytobacillus firmus]WHY62347.1 RDD family protein [Cytobacillus firmus]